MEKALDKSPGSLSGTKVWDVRTACVEAGRFAVFNRALVLYDAVLCARRCYSTRISVAASRWSSVAPPGKASYGGGAQGSNSSDGCNSAAGSVDMILRNAANVRGGHRQGGGHVDVRFAMRGMCNRGVCGTSGRGMSPSGRKQIINSVLSCVQSMAWSSETCCVVLHVQFCNARELCILHDGVHLNSGFC